MTPHNEARPGDYADTVLLPGDPDRAVWIADTFLDSPRLVNSIRGEFGFTGLYRGMPVSVQSTGMGRPSFNIYVHELMAFYGVRRAIRVGTCGGLQAEIGIRQVVIVDAGRMDVEVEAGAPPWRPDATLLASAIDTARKSGLAHHVGPVVSSDTFYHPDPVGRFAKAREEGAIVCDMESSSLYALATMFRNPALSICTVVDNLISCEETARSERQGLFTGMCRLALDTLLDTSR